MGMPPDTSIRLTTEFGGLMFLIYILLYFFIGGILIVLIGKQEDAAYTRAIATLFWPALILIAAGIWVGTKIMVNSHLFEKLKKWEVRKKMATKRKEWWGLIFPDGSLDSESWGFQKHDLCLYPTKKAAISEGSGFDPSPKPVKIKIVIVK
jgi:hypothetical protein